MSPADLTSRVSRDACVLGVALAGPAAYLAGAPAALGALAGAGLAVGNFRWLAASAARALDAGPARPLWTIGAALRFGAVVAACGALLATGAAHPVALLAGLTMLPCAVVARALSAARREG
jgi:hypothetical protein